MGVKEYTGEVVTSGPKEYTGEVIPAGHPYIKAEPSQASVADVKSMIENQKPGIESAKFDRGPQSFSQEHPLTASYYAGVASPFAGLSQYFGMDKPAEYLKEMTQEAESTGRTGTGLAKVGGELIGLGGAGKAIFGLASKAAPYVAPVASQVTQAVPKLGELATKAKDIYDSSSFLRGAGVGAGTAAVLPTEVGEGESFAKKKLEDIGEGSLFGGVAGKGTQMIFDPVIGQKLKMLKEMGMNKFTPAQLMADYPLIGNAVQKMESAATSIPLIGSMISSGKKVAISDFNKAIGNKVLEPMGESVDKGINAGHEMIEHINKKVGDAYDNIKQNLSFNAAFPTNGQSAVKSLTDKLRDVTDNLEPHEEKLVTDAFNKFIVNPLSTKLDMTGEQFRLAESRLGKAAFNAFKKGDYNIGSAYRDLQSELRQQLANQNPAFATELRGIHDAFIRYTRLEKAAAYRGAQEGVFSPSQFKGAVETLGGKKATATGKAVMQKEANAAEDILGGKVRDSGTAERIMTPLAIVKGLAAAPLIATAGLYNKPAMWAMTKLATERPELMKKLSPYLEPIASREVTALNQDEKQKPVGGLNLKAR